MFTFIVTKICKLCLSHDGLFYTYCIKYHGCMIYRHAWANIHNKYGLKIVMLNSCNTDKDMVILSYCTTWWMFMSDFSALTGTHDVLVIND